MDRRDHPPSGRGGCPAQGLTAPDWLEWTRQPGVGPGPAILGELAGAKVVELGCGSGHNLAHMVACRGALGVGVDHDPAKVDLARAHYGHLPGIRFALADVGHFLNDAAPRSADLVVSIFGAFSFTDPLPLLISTAIVLRSGGLLVMTLRADDEHDVVAVLRRR